MNWIVKWAFSPEKYMVLMLKAARIAYGRGNSIPMICKFKRLIRPFHGRVWSKKNETLSKSAIFQLRKYNFKQNLIFHELTTFTNKIFWVKNHVEIEKLQFLEIKSDRFYT